MESSHSIYIPDMDIHIPLQIKGVILYYESHKPSADELETCWQIVMTSDAPWDPYDPVFTDQEMAAAYKAKISAVVQNGDNDDDGAGHFDDEASHSGHFDGHSDGHSGQNASILDNSLARSADSMLCVFPEPAELLPEDVLAEKMIASVNISGDDWYGDGLHGYTDELLYPGLALN